MQKCPCIIYWKTIVALRSHACHVWWAAALSEQTWLSVASMRYCEINTCGTLNWKSMLYMLHIHLMANVRQLLYNKCSLIFKNSHICYAEVSYMKTKRNCLKSVLVFASENTRCRFSKHNQTFFVRSIRNSSKNDFYILLLDQNSRKISRRFIGQCG